jgi:transcriptional regulator with XRE-family HTH domain
MSNNKRYESVSAMLNDVAGDDSALTAAEFDQYISERKLVKDLTILRSCRNMSQEEIANKLGHSQSWVSKLENGTDDDLRIGDLRAYLSALGLEFRPGVTKQGATITDEIKLLAFAIRQKLITLAGMAKEGDGIVKYIANFFGDAFHNINRFLSEAAARLPCAPDRRPYISIVTMVEEMHSLEEEEKEDAKQPVGCRLPREPALN